MLILHVSDLHLAGTTSSLDEIWQGPKAALKGAGLEAFDAVVVSGDLSDTAEAKEYDQLRTFANSTLLPLLRNPERRRIIFVPGNHDVQWKANVGNPVTVASLRGRKAPKKSVSDVIRRESRAPALADLRYRIADNGTLAFTRLDRNRYGKRFSNVQQFLGTFYQGELVDPDRFFDLTHPDDSEHWSAHVFNDAGVAIYGFSSCHGNDRDWTGAHISQKAIASARAHADRCAGNSLRIAVWHHGLVGEQGRPDHLTLLTLGALHNAGFRVALHGHTHSESADTLDRFFRDQFVVLGTGSLGAAAADRPDAVGNQFSVLRLNARQVKVELFERNGATGEYQRRHRRVYAMGHASPQLNLPTTAREHRRTWAIRDQDGIADVNVELRGLELNGPVRLAILAPPFGGVAADKEAEAAAPLSIAADNLDDGRKRFVLSGSAASYDRCTWNYHVSNAFALHRADVGNMQERGSSAPRDLQADEEGRSHTVRIPCDRLVLKYCFRADETVVEKGSGRVIVERRVHDHGEDRWERVPQESERCAKALRVDVREVELAFDDPIVGLRYTPVFRLARTGPVRDPAATRAAKTVLDRVRSESVLSAKAFAANFTRMLEPELQRVLQAPKVDADWLGEHGAWIGFLWHDERRLIFPAFGRFPTASWAVRFGAGKGVAGQAFRFGAAAAWHKGATSSLIYASRTEIGGPFQRDYDWIVALPVQVPGHAPVGVVSFAGTEHQSTAAAKLYDLAVEMVGGKTGLTLAQDLQSIIAAQFWRAVRKHLAGAHRVTASGILQKLQRKAANGRPRKKPGGARHK